MRGKEREQAGTGNCDGTRTGGQGMIDRGSGTKKRSQSRRRDEDNANRIVVAKFDMRKEE